MGYTDEQKAYHRAYYHQRRQRLVDYLGGACVICGTTSDLHFDHKDPNQKSFNISTRLTLESAREELDKCQLLCAPHHREKTAQENSGYTHGTVYAWMKKHCECPDCLIAKWLWHDLRNEKRRKPHGRGPYQTRRADQG